MSTKYIDGIVRLKTQGALKSFSASARSPLKEIMQVDGIRRPVLHIRQPKVDLVTRLSFPEKLSQYFSFSRKMLNARLPVFLAVFFVIIAFATGAWVTLETRQTAAETIQEDPPVIEHYYIALPQGPQALGPIANVPNEVLFNLSLEQLENYLNEMVKTPEAKEAEVLAARKEKLKKFLAERNSPLIKAVDTIAEQKYWKLILAISFAESSLGKNCVDNNCSNIGVKPGHPAWRQYATLSVWAKDFNRLLEKKYKDWTLEEMNGVYVQPKNPNWLLATRQILTALAEQGIE